LLLAQVIGIERSDLQFNNYFTRSNTNNGLTGGAPNETGLSKEENNKNMFGDKLKQN
jgi:hypothetical protein